MDYWHWLVVILVAYLLLAYFLAPRLWRRYERRHPALADAPRVTHTHDGIPGDPLNVGLVGGEEQLHASLLVAGWFPADPVTLASSIRIALGTVLHRSYADAPVSSLYLWGRKQDLAFEQAVGKDPRQRHHVRFWRSAKLDEAGRPLWLGAATFDTKVGLSHTTGQITHHIGAEVDSERDKILADMQQAGQLGEVGWVDGFHDRLSGKNGGGDHYHTDGRLGVGVLAARGPLVGTGFPLDLKALLAGADEAAVQAGAEEANTRGDSPPAP